MLEPDTVIVLYDWAIDTVGDGIVWVDGFTEDGGYIYSMIDNPIIDMFRLPGGEICWEVEFQRGPMNNPSCKKYSISMCDEGDRNTATVIQIQGMMDLVNRYVAYAATDTIRI